MKRLLAVLMSMLFAGCTIFGIRTIEQANYTVALEDGDIQIRKYDNVIVAETLVEAEYKESGSIAFRRLAGYIFGKNTSAERISMTAPVLQEKVGKNWKMSFVMPQEYTSDMLPRPLDPKVVLKEVPGRKIAAIRY